VALLIEDLAGSHFVYHSTEMEKSDLIFLRMFFAFSRDPASVA
jgi:hypothetical protein